MNIIEALKSENIRVSNGRRWLVWEEAFSVWAVYERKYNQKKTRAIVTTEDEEEAIKCLLYQENE